jgi:putative flavoprotein involved in K+ transport
VLVVGASASGVQLADELHRSGRPVTLAVGEHVRMPRTYRGRDILWWLDAAGVLDQRYDEVDDLVRARNVPSMQLVGSPGRTVDLNALSSAGVRLAGRLAGIAGRGRPVLRLPAQRVRAGRPEAGAAAEHHRRLGGGGR